MSLFLLKVLSLKQVHVYIHRNTRSPAQVILLAPNIIIFLSKLYYYKYTYFMTQFQNLVIKVNVTSLHKIIIL